MALAAAMDAVLALAAATSASLAAFIILASVKLAGFFGRPAAAAPFLARGSTVVAKILSPDIIHKSEVRGVCLNLASKRAVREAVTDILARAHAAYLTWRQTPVAERAKLFLRFAELVEASADELARLVTLEMGKTLAQSKGEASIAVAMFRYYALHGEELLADEETVLPGFTKAITRREPVGVVLGIEPWNGPLYQAMRATAPNLMLGNTVLVKPSEVSAGSTLFFDHLFAALPAHLREQRLTARHYSSKPGASKPSGH